MSREVWLRPNRRVMAVGIVILILLMGGALGLLAMSQHVAVTALGWTIAAVSLLLFIAVVRTAGRPRLAYDDGCLLVFLGTAFLGTAQPHRVPIELVECFFLGQGPSLLPAAKLAGVSDSPQSSTIVVRLAESAEEWKHVEVKPSLGLWCDGYITIRGTWCEPINAERMKQLNHRLVETRRQRRQLHERETV